MYLNSIVKNWRCKIQCIWIVLSYNAKQKNMCVYGHMSKKSMVSRSALIFYFFFLSSAKPEIVIPCSGISFAKFLVSCHLLKLFYDELRSFSTFFALNFDKKLAVEWIKHCCWLNNKNGYPNSVWKLIGSLAKIRVE
jgi:hypothetical protein